MQYPSPPDACAMPVASAICNGKRRHIMTGAQGGTQLPICTTYRAHAGRRIASRSLLLPLLGWSPPKAVDAPTNWQDKILCDFLRALQ